MDLLAGSNNLEKVKALGDTRRAGLIEKDFHRLTFEAEGV